MLLIHKNLISIHKFTHDNNVIIEFHPFFYLVKDQITGAMLICNRCKDGVYPAVALSSFSPQANQIRLAGTSVSIDHWHHLLRHLTPKIFSSLLRSHALLVSPVSLHCLVFLFNVVSHINYHLVPLLSRVLSLLNFCMPMCGDLHRFLPLMAIDIIDYLLIILLSIADFIPCNMNLMLVLHLFNLLLWLRINFHVSLETYTQKTMINLSDYIPFSLLMVLAIIPLPPHTPLNKTTWLNVTIAMLLK